MPQDFRFMCDHFSKLCMKRLNCDLFQSFLVMLYVIWYPLDHLKNVKNIQGGLFSFSRVAGLALATLLITPPLVFLRFLNCTNGTKSCKASRLCMLVSFNTFSELWPETKGFLLSTKFEIFISLRKKWLLQQWFIKQAM